MKCNICPRKCNIERTLNTDSERGFCGQSLEIRLARAALHYWEEPCISGSEGSGAVFFSGCNLKCIFCQNRDIAIGSVGKTVSVERLAEIYLELQEKGANNINLVTGAHYIDSIIQSVINSRNQGLKIPIVYNTSSYETVDAIKKLEGIVDIYLPDFKYYDTELARNYSNAADYTEVAKAAIAEMVRQCPDAHFNDDGIMTSGVIVRHMIIPGETNNSKNIIKYLHDNYGDSIYLSIMNQYTPPKKELPFSNLNRKVTKREYEKVISYAIDEGVENGFFQEGETAKDSFIPEFNYEGI